jgi:hypothetical protein
VNYGLYTSTWGHFQVAILFPALYTSVVEERKLDKSEYGESKRVYSFRGLTDRHYCASRSRPVPG